MHVELISDPVFKWEVSFTSSKDKKEYCFMAVYRALTYPELTYILSRGDDASQVVVDKALINWEGVVDENGNPIPFDDGCKKHLMTMPEACHAIVEGFCNGITGGTYSQQGDDDKDDTPKKK